jgi:hypothetical protein
LTGSRSFRAAPLDFSLIEVTQAARVQMLSEGLKMKDYLKVLGWLFFSLLFPSLFLVMVLQLSSAERESSVNSGLVRAAADSRTDLPPRVK